MRRMPSGNTGYKLWLAWAHLENPAKFPKPVSNWRGQCPDTTRLIYKHVAHNFEIIENQ
jgi:hypothetical protein